MFESYEKIPEWIRWLLFVPAFFGIMFIFSFLFQKMSIHLEGTFLYSRIFAPLVGGAAIVYLVSRLIPRVKIFASYLICCFWIPLISLGILSVIAIPPEDGGFTMNELIQSTSALFGSLAATLQARNKYREQA